MRTSAAPVCAWCHEPIEPDSPYRGEPSEPGYPPGTGLYVCSPACQRRDGRRVWEYVRAYPPRPRRRRP